jgi:hypothetical protein
MEPDKIEVYDNKGKKVPEIDPLRWTNAHHTKAFDLHFPRGSKPSEPMMTRNSTGREQPVIIVHRIKTSWSLSEIKTILTVQQVLRDHKVYLSEHRWKETVWNTTQLGFIVGLDPKFYNPEQAAECLIQDIKNHTTDKPKIPHFRMAFCTPSMKLYGYIQRTDYCGIGVLTYGRTGYCLPLLHLRHHHVSICPDVDVRTLTLHIRDSKLNANPRVT